MENVFDFGRVSYVPAESIKEASVYEKCVFMADFLFNIIKVIVLSIPHLINAFVRLFVSPEKKFVNGQTVLITGGGNGLGKAMAIQFAREGCNIAIADIDSFAAEKTAKELNEMNVIAYHVDIADSDQVNKLKIDIENDMPPVHILILNAGIIPLMSIREGTEKEIKRIIEVNITSQICVTRAFLPGMIERKRGHIAGLSSMCALHPVSGSVIYSTTKSAMHTLIISLNEELRQEGNECTKCTSIHPYFISTRKDRMDAANLTFPPITPETAANVAVDAILRNELILSIPRSHIWFTILIQLLPVILISLNKYYYTILYNFFNSICCLLVWYNTIVLVGICF